MLVHRAADGATRLADFFVAAPGLGQRAAQHGEMQVVDVGFGETTTQPFRIGPASCAVCRARSPGSRQLIGPFGKLRGGELSRPLPSFPRPESSSPVPRPTCMRCSIRSFAPAR
jgi:hypothetical protein